MASKNWYFKAANTEPFIRIKGKTTGREFFLRQFTYGVLVPNPNHPLSTVSVSNSSLSIDLWVGCAWQCRYCHVQGTYQDLVDEGAMSKNPRRRNSFSVEQILDELIKHPFFIPDKTVISIGTASTEPFAPGPVTDSTFKIMNAFIKRGLHNPFWIVTKAGIPKGRKSDFARIVKATRGLMLSLCWADNPSTIEPVRNNRFSNTEEAKEAGATIAWYMRPIVSEWSGNPERIEMMMSWVKKHYGDVIDMIVPGGLRWTEGIEYGLTEIHNLPMPNIPRNDNMKFLPQEVLETIISVSKEYFPSIPLYFKSSCAISKMLQIPNIISVQAFARQACEMSLCPTTQRQICAQSPIYRMTVERAQQVLNQLGIPANAISWDLQHGLITQPEINKFTYAIKQTVFKHLAMERVKNYEQGGRFCQPKRYVSR
jgi:DNA repair photolyase